MYPYVNTENNGFSANVELFDLFVTQTKNAFFI